MNINEEKVEVTSKNVDDVLNIDFKIVETTENKEITGYLEFSNSDVNITINDNGIYETILKFFVDEVNSNKKIIENTNSAIFDINN